MTCTWHAEKQRKKAAKKKVKEEAKRKSEEEKLADRAASLTEAQRNYVRSEAVFAEKLPGGEHSIEECAWQLREHPLVIGGGSLVMRADGTETFRKGDVAKIYRERLGVEYDGSPRFGLPPYSQRKPYANWIARAHEAKI